MDKMAKLDQLIDDAEELLIQLADARNPEIQELRDRVDRAINDARRSIAGQVDDVSDQLLDIVNKVDDAIRDYPWIAIAAAIVVAGTVAFFAGSARAQHAEVHGARRSEG
jgi:ElaB/YqjD/DUF883 family membrane-anchored ribosome-binding protein